MPEDGSKFWRDLLLKYLGYVEMIEGTNFTTFNEADWFTEEEWNALKMCDTIMMMQKTEGKL